jgi:mycofactocin system creatininase family protein
MARELGAMTWDQIDRPIVVVPVGSCEQHGRHLPLDTDTVIAVALARAFADRRPDCVVAPPITVTASGEHRGFPGTLSVGTEIMAGIVVELARSADWAAGVVFVNGHGGNVTAMQRATEVFDVERRRVLVWSPRVPGGDPHAGHTETSLMLALAPDSVRLDAARPGPVPSFDALVREGVRPLSPSGVLGDPTGADAEAGRRIFDDLIEQLTTAVTSWTSTATSAETSA